MQAGSAMYVSLVQDENAEPFQKLRILRELQRSIKPLLRGALLSVDNA